MAETLTAAVYGRQSRGKEKSIAEQIDLCSADAAEQGWTVTNVYRDRTSASRYRRRDREEWAAVVAAVADRRFDVLILWVSSRGDRDLTSWSSLLDACRTQGVLIRVTDDDRTYDVRKSGDWQALAQQGVGNAVDSDKISTSVKRGHAGAASKGRPSHGPAPWGFVRTYSPTTGELIGQEHDPVAAPIVREVFERLAKSEPLASVARDLNRREIPRPSAGSWQRQRIKDLAMNPAYAGLRQYNGQLFPAGWEAIVDEATFYAVRRILTDPARTTTRRPGRQAHLLSYLIRCGTCGNTMCTVAGRYRCTPRGCAGIVQADADRLVVAAVLERLASPEVYATLREAGSADDREALAAEAEVARLDATLTEWRLSAARGQTTPDSLAVIEADLSQQIKAARKRLERASIPPALREVLEPGQDVALRWERLTLPAKRDVIRRLADVVVLPTRVQGSKKFDPTRFDNSRWNGDQLTWGERRAK